MNPSKAAAATAPTPHAHVFLGAGHDKAEKSTWAVIWLCGAMMALEIAGGLMFGSIALVADGLHMSTHAGALLLSALAYSYARKHAYDPRFTFGTGKLGDLAGFTSAIILAMISLLIGYEAVSRLFVSVPIRFAEAIPIAILGLVVNILSAWLLSRGGHDHAHSHSHGASGHDAEHRIETPQGAYWLSVFEDGAPPVFRLRHDEGHAPDLSTTIETLRPNGSRRSFAMAAQGDALESIETVPEPHEFTATAVLRGHAYVVSFNEPAQREVHGHDASHRDNNMRAAIVHVAADSAVSVLVIAGLLLASTFGWMWMDALAGLVGAFVIAGWSYGLIRDTGSILLDVSPDPGVAEEVRRAIERDGDKVVDLHLWRLGPGHLSVIVSIATKHAERGPEHYRKLLSGFRSLSHLTVEIAKC